jgi:hypothetical protein
MTRKSTVYALLSLAFWVMLLSFMWRSQRSPGERPTERGHPESRPAVTRAKAGTADIDPSGLSHAHALANRRDDGRVEIIEILDDSASVTIVTRAEAKSLADSLQVMLADTSTKSVSGFYGKSTNAVFFFYRERSRPRGCFVRTCMVDRYWSNLGYLLRQDVARLRSGLIQAVGTQTGADSIDLQS